MDPKTKAEQKKYQELVKGHSKKTPILKHVVLAFLIGGSICLIGQIALNYFSTVERTQGEAAATTLAFMIFLGAMATGFGVYDILGKSVVLAQPFRLLDLLILLWHRLWSLDVKGFF